MIIWLLTSASDQSHQLDPASRWDLLNRLGRQTRSGQPSRSDLLNQLGQQSPSGQPSRSDLLSQCCPADRLTRCAGVAGRASCARRAVITCCAGCTGCTDGSQQVPVRGVGRGIVGVGCR